jgi:hypothetical protein
MEFFSLSGPGWRDRRTCGKIKRGKPPGGLGRRQEKVWSPWTFLKELQKLTPPEQSAVIEAAMQQLRADLEGTPSPKSLAARKMAMAAAAAALQADYAVGSELTEIESRSLAATRATLWPSPGFPRPTSWGIVSLIYQWEHEMNSWLKENVGPILAMITVIGTFALFALAFFLKVDGTNEKVLFMVIGALSSIATTVVTYYFGSSEGSAKKNEIFQGMKEKI